jgi:hypothetical protein
VDNGGVSRKLKNTDLKDALAAAEGELVSLLKRAETLREWIAVTKKLRAKNTTAGLEGAESSPMVRSRRTKTTGLLQNVMEVLEAAGGPLHVDDIVRKLSENDHPITARNPKAAIAVALSRRPDQFRKTAPNTFGLASASPERAATVAS